MEKSKIYTFKAKAASSRSQSPQLQHKSPASSKASLNSTADSSVLLDTSPLRNGLQKSPSKRSINITANSIESESKSNQNAAELKNNGNEKFVNVDMSQPQFEPSKRPKMPEMKSLPEITLFDVFIDDSPDSTRNQSSASLDKAVSMTRQRTLPPKHPKEERKHVKLHQEIMSKAKQKEQEIQRKIEKKRKHREDLMQKNLKIWQLEIMPKWPRSKDLPKTREIWWQGIPPIIRGRVWKLAIPNDLRLTPTMFQDCLGRAEKLIHEKYRPSEDLITFEQEKFLLKSIEMIKLDASRTFPSYGLFQEHGPLQGNLISVLQAFSVYRPDLGYVQGMSFHAAMFLVNLDMPDTFIAMANLFNKPFLTSFYLLDHAKMDRYYRVFQMFFGQFLPDLYLHFITLNIEFNMFLLEWFLSIYSRSLSIDIAMRIWDCFFLLGEVFLIRMGIGLLKYLRPRLLPGGFETCVYLLTHLPRDIDEDDLFLEVESIEISPEKYFSLLGSIP